MKQIKSKCGYIVFECSAAEISIIGGFGICDHCNEYSTDGYLIPVLSRWICSECYAKWDNKAIYYAEDIPFEKETAAYYKSKIPIT